MELLSAEEARDALLQKGVTAVPGLKTLEQAVFGKVFSGRLPDGSLWKVSKERDNGFTVS